MNSLLQNLEHFNLLRDGIWDYLTIKDICQILILNKNHRNIFLATNELYSHHTISLTIVQCNLYDKCKILNNMLKSFPNINSLFLFWKYDINTNNNDNNMDIDSMSILYNTKSICNSLKELQINYIYDSGVNGISNFSNLRVLNINGAPVTNQSLLEISQMINITSLDISNCYYISEEGFCYLIKLSKLVKLNLSGCELSEVVLENLSLLINLVDFKLKWCYTLSNSRVFHLSNLINLEYLNLHSAFEITNLSFLTPLIKIKSLNLHHCNLLQDNLDSSSIHYLTNITLLDLSFCSLLTDKSIYCLRNLTNLISLSLKGLSLLKSLSHLNLLVNLEYLDVSRCCLITDDEMVTIYHLTKIKELYLQECEQLTDAAYNYLKSLDHINILIEDGQFIFITKTIFE
jgi:hypothetical protein